MKCLCKCARWKNSIEKDLPLFLPSDNYSMSNPEGYVNLGTAVNGLCEGGILLMQKYFHFKLTLILELLSERLRRDDLWRHESDWQHYFGLNGTPDLLRVTTNFLQERLAQVSLFLLSLSEWEQFAFSPSIKGEKLSAENLRMVNGVSGGLEALAWIISDPGDLVIVPTPTYARWMMWPFLAIISSPPGFLQTWTRECQQKWWGCIWEKALNFPRSS